MSSQIVTEEVASRCWCPAVRLVQAGTQMDSQKTNRGLFLTTVGYKDCNCIGSRCMKWEWHDEMENRGRCGL